MRREPRKWPASTSTVDSLAPYGQSTQVPPKSSKSPKADRLSNCRWKNCNVARSKNSWFCVAHTTPPDPEQFPQWLRQLPYILGTGLATNLVYDMLKNFLELVAFNDNAANHVHRLMRNLQSEKDPYSAIDEVATFVELTRDPGFVKDMAKVLACSASIPA